MRQRIVLQLEAHILDRLCQTQGCQFDRLLFCNPSRITLVFNLSEALNVLCYSSPRFCLTYAKSAIPASAASEWYWT
jgi:hypothetical protein